MPALTPVELAERVATLARDLGIETALVGAYALAVHRYVRGTSDIDLGVTANIGELRALKVSVESVGLSALLTLPDDQDPLGGVLKVWTDVDEDGDPVFPLDVVNYLNPFRPRRTPATAAIANAFRLDETPGLRCPRLADLIALKLDVAATSDDMDVVNVLVANPEADLEEIRTTCKRYGFERIDDLIAFAQTQRR